MHLAPDEVGERGSFAAVRHMRDIGTGHHLEELAVDVLRAANAARAHVSLARIGFGIGDQFGDAARGKLRVHHHHPRGSGNACDRDDVANEIEAEVFVERHIDDIGGNNQQEGVAVGWRAHDHFSTDIGAPASAVLDHERLAQPLRQFLANEAREDVARSAGSEWSHNAHRPRGIALRPRDEWQNRQCGSGRGRMQKLAASETHPKLRRATRPTARPP